MKIANITEEGRLAGPQYRIANVAENLKTLYDVDTIVVFPLDNSNEFKRLLLERHVDYKRLTLHGLSRNMIKLLLYVLTFPLDIIRITLFFNNKQIDIVHVSSGSASIKSVIAAKLSRRKLIWHLTDTGSPKIVKSIFRFIAKRMCNNFIVAGEKVQDYYLQDLKNANVFEIPAPVNCTIFDPDKYKNKNQSNKIKILTVANISPVKGIELFINVVNEINKLYNNIEFYIVGNVYETQAKYYTKLLDMITKYKIKNIIFMGAQKNIAEIMSSADIYLCTSVAEASPISVWEAMAMRLAIVSTDVGDVSKYIHDGRNGYIVPINDTDEMVNKVEILINDRAKRDLFGKNAREVAKKHLDIQVCAEKHFLCYKGCL